MVGAMSGPRELEGTTKRLGQTPVHSAIIDPMQVTVRVELYGLCFPMVFEGPPWSEYDPAKNTSSADWEPGAHVVELLVDDSWTLGHVLNEAADQFGIHLVGPHSSSTVAK